MKNDIDIKICYSFSSRLKGFMFKKDKLPYGLYFPKCNSIHTFFCRQPLSVYFIDRDGNILLHEPYLKPWKVKTVKKAWGVLEFSVDMVDEKTILKKIET